MQESGQEKTCVVNLAKKREGLAETVGELLAFNDERGLWLILNRPHRADLGRCCAQLDDSHRRRIFPLLADELAADVLAELDTLTMFDVAEDLAEGDLSGLIEAMEPDDAADLLGELRTEELERVLGLIPVQEAEPIREVLSHDEDTGGGIMNSRLLTVGEGGMSPRLSPICGNGEMTSSFSISTSWMLVSAWRCWRRFYSQRPWVYWFPCFFAALGSTWRWPPGC